MQHPIMASMGYLFLLAIATLLSLTPQPTFAAPNIIPPPNSAPFAHRIKITLPPGFQLGSSGPSSPTGSNSMMLDADKIDNINININNSNNNNNEPTSSSGGSGAATNGTEPVNNNNNNNDNSASTTGSTINININNNNNNNNDPSGATPGAVPGATRAASPVPAVA